MMKEVQSFKYGVHFYRMENYKDHIKDLVKKEKMQLGRFRAKDYVRMIL